MRKFPGFEFRVFAKVAVLSAIALLPRQSAAGSVLQKITVANQGSSVAVKLNFDNRVNLKSFKPTFERNFVQFVLRDTKMTSAQIIPVNSANIEKVFAYPYSPTVARVRLILKQEGNWAKGKVAMKSDGANSIVFSILESKTADADISAVKKAGIQSASASGAAPSSESSGRLLDEVIANTSEIDIHNPDSVKAALDSPKKNDQSKGESGKVGTKDEPSRSFWKMILSLIGVLAVFGGVVLVIKRYSNKLNKLPFGKKDRLIQVVATHYLGNKKSISLVKVTGEYLVLGVSNDGLSLISKMGPELNVDKYLEDRFWNGTFEKHLDVYSKDKKISKEVDLSKYDGVRDVAAVAAETPVSTVRASIREKLTKLKPLA